ncbi:hypothetical protein RRG08_002079 [Elysia crispata]|uniref:Uncharacterized protein n=1 Tax=Elysia crispata TaxID=231223 RepID=A0AAE1DHR7_9GAST|nr:hypothetical protein RRG08_002079 [Elysia crispata]
MFGTLAVWRIGLGVPVRSGGLGWVYLSGLEDWAGCTCQVWRIELGVPVRSGGLSWVYLSGLEEFQTASQFPVNDVSGLHNRSRINVRHLVVVMVSYCWGVATQQE